MTKEQILKKECKYCEQDMVKKPKYSYKQWASREYCSNLCRAKAISKFQVGHTINVGIPTPLETRRKISKALSGNKTHLWKGGITKKNKLIRTGMEFRNWRKLVFERDDYTCQECELRGVELNAHHIKSFALYPELRYEIDNGKTLCVECHKETPTYKGKMKNYAFV
jgi:hypothetical protein